MPISMDIEVPEILDLEATMDFFSSIDISDRDALLSGAPILRGLSNNRRFLAERISNELKQTDSLQQSNQYSSQVFFLGRGKEYFVRANFWPAENDQIIQVSGKHAFFYGVPHDHNFDFLTVGYYGPGYLSDFYEYDFDEVIGYPGEKVNLKFMGREALPEGRVVLYRSSLDIHEQLPPESFSISLNIVSDRAKEIATINQYMLDLNSRTIQSLGNRTSLPLICEIAGQIGDDECRDVLSNLCKSHPYSRGRFAAYQALARLCPQDEEAIWSKASKDSAKFVNAQASLRLHRLEVLAGASS
jgi:hypothetical protein